MWVGPAHINGPGAAQGKGGPTAGQNGWAVLGPEDISLWGGPDTAHTYGLGRIKSGPPPMLIISAET